MSTRNWSNLETLGFRATSWTRMRARDHCTSSTLIGRKSKARPSSLHTTLEGPTEYVNARWIQSVHVFLQGIEWIMFHGHLDYFLKTTYLEVGLTQNQETMALQTLTTIGVFSFIVREDPHEWKCIETTFCWGPCHIRPHTTLEGPWPHVTISDVCWDGRPLDTYTPPTLTGVGPPANGEFQQGLQLAALTG